MLVMYFYIILISFLTSNVSCTYDLGYGISNGRGEINALSVNNTKSPRQKRSKGRFDFNRLQGTWRYSKEEIKEIFEEYYSCLDNYMKRENRITEAITAILALEGQRVELKCPICVRPDRKTKIRSTRLFWQRVRNADATTTHINHKTKGVKIKRDMTLIFNKIDVADAGQYYCVNDGDFEVIYQVDVLFNEPQRSVSENNTSSLLPAQKLVDHNIKVFTHWSEWGDCDQCDRNGRRLKFGTCMVEKIDLNKPITPYDIPVMSLYPHGFCYRHCPTTPPPIVVTDENGEVVEIIEGGYHPIDKKPDLPPIVKREVKHHAVGTNIKLTCPTSEKGKVRWQRGDRPINSATIRHQTKGRVFIDKLNRLHIRKFRIRDSAPYSCWTWRTHIGTFKIIGFEPMNEDIKHYITYGGLLITIIGIPLYCVCKICFGKPKRRKR